MYREIELKLTLRPQDAVKILRHPLLNGTRQSEELHSIYYDTAAHELKKRGFALRLRRSGSRTVQTLKAQGWVAGGLHERPEWEADARRGKLNREALKETPLARVCALDRILLLPVFSTHFKRTRRMIENGEHAIELSLDSGEINAHGAVSTISEIELELVKGAPSQLYTVALALNRAAALSIANASKAERGYALAAGAEPAPVKAEALTLNANTPVCEALRAIAFSCIAHYQGNTEMCADPEYVHQMRVALRRLRSALNLFALLIPPAAITPFRDELRWLARELGGARDWDVFVDGMLSEIANKFPDHRGLAALTRKAATARRRANTRAKKAVASQRSTEVFLRLCAWLSEEGWNAWATEGGKHELSFPIAGFVRRVLDKRHKQLLKSGAGLNAMDEATFHRLRIGAKKLRYAAEFFASLFAGKRTQKYLSALMSVQDAFGEMNDRATTAQLLDSLSEKTEAAAIVRGYIAASEQTNRLQEAWEDWSRVKTFW